ncbi:hypothetical protein Tco_0222381, partial [Tanacetum coccineum]
VVMSLNGGVTYYGHSHGGRILFNMLLACLSLLCDHSLMLTASFGDSAARGFEAFHKEDVKDKCNFKGCLAMAAAFVFCSSSLRCGQNLEVVGVNLVAGEKPSDVYSMIVARTDARGIIDIREGGLRTDHIKPVVVIKNTASQSMNTQPIAITGAAATQCQQVTVAPGIIRVQNGSKTYTHISLLNYV